ncbi:septum formation family protein [Dactylosporangium sp. NPDC000521]|uniref:septum formation family protein n=1 Tax=Dactylosporangium sp. NPDC000521 TaxID=3363975 RepID=UPI0036BFBEEE
MKLKIAIGVAVALVVSCCGFALYRRFAPNHHASGDKGCYASTTDADTVAPSRCGEPHEAEMVDFFYPDGADAGCHRSAEDFLGGPLADARIELRLLNYEREDFTSLACALIVVSDSEGTDAVHTGSLRGAMSGDRPMAITCGHYTGGTLKYLTCAEAHSAEYVGSVADGGDHDTSCRQAAAAYLGLTPDEFATRRDLRSDWLTTPRDGHRTGCVVVAASGNDVLTGSVKDLRAGPLPA